MFVFSNLATSLDGKIATASRELFPLGTPEDRKQMQRLRAECDVVLMGAATLRAWRKPCFAEGAAKQPANAIVSSALEGISPAWPFFTSAKLKRILFVSERAPKARLKRFEKTCEIVRLARPTPKKPAATQILSALEKLGHERVLVEGGGSLMWDFVRQDLIDEYHVTLTPRLIGGTEAPTLVDGSGFAPKQVVNLRLEQVRPVGDEIYLIYRKTGKRG
jgi:riboflavin-specific deaminase-like protein